MIGSRMRSQQSFQLLVQMVVFPLTFLAGVFFPVNNVPRWMEIISKLNPLTYGVDAIRRIFLADDLCREAARFEPPDHRGDRLRAYDHDARRPGAGGLLGAALLAGAIFSFNRQV